MITFFGVGELLVNSRALLVKYEGKLYMPVFGAFHPGNDFGLDYNNETNYRELKRRFEAGRRGQLGRHAASSPTTRTRTTTGSAKTGSRSTTRPPPSFSEKHFLGTDNTARDIFARLFYGFRTAMIFALLFLPAST